MWIYNEGEAFHPHAVDMEQRHQMFEVVGSKTKCKNDFAVKSVSEFIAPRSPPHPPSVLIPPPPPEDRHLINTLLCS
jgi:hypothetical protein